MATPKQYHIVSGDQLPSFSGKNVSLFGIVTENGTEGSSCFTLNAADNVSTKVFLNNPITKNVNGVYIEVRGICEQKQREQVIHAEEMFTFSNTEFDAESHVELCTFMNSIPNVYSNKN